jgi:hypothetical protein
MLTTTGEPIVYLDPARTRVHGRDVYVHLSNACRYAGAVHVPILLHLALCVRLAERMGCSPEALAYVAAHDIVEAYIGDLPTGLKQVLPEWDERIEAPWEAHVHAQLGLAWPMPSQIAVFVKSIDLLALVVEKRVFRHPGYHETVTRIGREPTREECLELDTLTDEDSESWFDTVARAIVQGGGRRLDYTDRA